MKCSGSKPGRYPRRIAWAVQNGTDQPLAIEGRVLPIRATQSLPVALALAFEFAFVGGNPMNGVIYLVGLFVVVMFVLSILGLR